MSSKCSYIDSVFVVVVNVVWVLFVCFVCFSFFAGEIPNTLLRVSRDVAYDVDERVRVLVLSPTRQQTTATGMWPPACPILFFFCFPRLLGHDTLPESCSSSHRQRS